MDAVFAIWEWLTVLFLGLSVVALGQVSGDGDDGGDDDGGDHDFDDGDGDDAPDPGAAFRAARPAGGTPPAGGQPGAGGAPAGGQPPDDAARRYEDLNGRFSTLERNYNSLGERYRRLEAAHAALAGAPPRPAAPTQADERSIRLREQFYGLYPENARPLMKKILEDPNVLQRVIEIAERAPDLQSSEERHWQHVARTATNALWNGAAPVLLGQGKTGKDLDEETRIDLQASFGRWIQRDPTGARADRYEAQDGELVGEFLTWFKGRYIDVGRRDGSRSVITRGERTARLPVAGAGGPTPRQQQRPKPDGDDDEAVHKNAWAVAQSLRAD